MNSVRFISILTLLLFGHGAQAAFRCETVFLHHSPSYAIAHSQVGVPNGAYASAIRDQGAASDCWAHTASEWMTNVYRLTSAARNLPDNRQSFLQDPHHDNVHVSPEHLLFFHIYSEIKLHLGTFRKLAKDLSINRPNATEKEKAELIKKFYRDEIRNSKQDAPEEDTQKSAYNYFTLDEGSNMADALKEAKRFGAAPKSAEKATISAADAEAQMETDLLKFTYTHLLDDKKLDLYVAKENSEDGLNDDLFKDLAHALKKTFPQTPHRPNEKFNYGGKTFTPLTFMSEKLGFDPDAYQAFTSSKKSQQQALEAIAEALQKGQAVPIGIPVFDDKDGHLSDRYQDEGIFTDEWCPNGICKEVEGGHEVLAVNFLYEGDPKLGYRKGDRITGLVFQNSWGHIGGRNINGQKTDVKNEQGYYVVTSGYLEQSLKFERSKGEDQYNVWDYALPKEISDRYKGKLKSQ